jgi:hypothetical protein
MLPLKQTDEDDDARSNQDRDALDGLPLHRNEANKKTRATQGCSGCGK